MSWSRFIALKFLVSIMILASGSAFSQGYPNKPIRIVTGAAGGGGDFAARLIAPELSGNLGQPVITENRGGNASIPAQIVKQAPPDGYTMLLIANSFWLLPLLQAVPYDPVGDFLPITLVASAPNILVVHFSVAANSVKELIALAKARPGALNYGSGTTGAINHLAAELFNAMARVNIVRIPYKGSAPALNALLADQVQLMFATAATVAPHVKSGRLRSLAVTSAQPSALAPGVPTIAASGLPGYESESVYGVFAPAKTLATLINRLNREMVRVLNSTDVKEKLFTTGAESVGSSPEQFAAAVKSDMAKMGKVIRDAGIRAE